MTKRVSRKTITSDVISKFVDIIPASARGKQRYAAFKGYLQFEPVEALAQYAVSRSSISAMCRQATQLHEDGRLWGYRVCEPGAYSSPRVRNPGSKSSAGRFVGWLDADTPELAKLRGLIELAAGMEHFNVAYFHREIFVPFCEVELGLNKGKDYPLVIADQSQANLRRYISNLRLKDVGGRLENEIDAKDASSSVIRSLIRVAKPMQILQFDECKIDYVGTISLEDATGKVRYIPVKDATMLLMVDANRPIIYGYIVFFHPVISLEDLLEAFAELDVQWQQRQIKAGRRNYARGAMLPSAAFPEFLGAQPSLVMGDRAKAHKAYQFSMLERLLRAFSYHLGKPHQWSIRVGVEGKFSVIDKRDLHNQPQTTGTGADDPRRAGAFETAVELALDADDFLGRIDVSITDYMVTGHGGPSGLTQLRDVLTNDKNFMTRTLPPPAAGAPPIGSFILNLRVRQDAVGHYVEHHALWYGPSLKKIQLGEAVAVLFQRSDVRYPTLYTAGAEDGKLFISAQWKSPSPLPYAALLATARFKAKHRHGETPQRSSGDLLSEVALLKEHALKSSRSKSHSPNRAASALADIQKGRAGQAQLGEPSQPQQLPAPKSSAPPELRDEQPQPLLLENPSVLVNTIDNLDASGLSEEIRERIASKGILYRGGGK